MKQASLERPQQILFATLVGVSLLVTLASAVSTRRPAQADPPVARSTATAAASPKATRPPSPTMPAPAWPSPTRTPITDLPTLVQQSDVVAHVKITGTNGAMHSQMAYIQVLKWFKRPAQVVTDTGVVWILDPFAGEFTPPRSFWDNEGAESILFLRLQGTNPWNDGSLAYELTGAPGGDTAIYQIQAGRIIDAGLLQYQGWTVADFAAAIRAAIPLPPSPSPILSLTATPSAADDLAHLAQQAEIIAEVQTVEGDGAVGSVILYTRVETWFKKPADYSKPDLYFRVYSEAVRHLGGMSRQNIVFLTSYRTGATGHLYQPVGDEKGIFGIENGIIGYTGLPQYQGWTVADFAAAIRAVLLRPELGLAPARPR